jgi:hypothetical protein
MSAIDLPQSIEHYFAFAEMEARGNTRRFTITLPYFKEGRLDRIQWWWRITDAELKIIGEAGLAARREREIQRFVRHVERWLEINRQRLHGTEPIPTLSAALVAEEVVEPAEAPTTEPAEPVWNPTRAAAG